MNRMASALPHGRIAAGIDMRLDRFLHALSSGTLFAIGLFLVILLGEIDYLTGDELSFSIFYLFPIYLVTWYGGGWPGAVISLASAGVWYGADALTANYSHPLIPYWNALVRLGFFLITTVLVAEIRKRFDREASLAMTDPLTTIANRRAFYHLADAEIARAGRTDRPFTVAYLDLDNFKLVNDQLGHHAGDELLRLIAQIIQDNIRRLDTVARLGGDEFTILLPETTQTQALELLERLKSTLTRTMNEKPWPVTFSIGAVTFTLPPPSVDDILRRTDNLLYGAKTGGKNMIKYDLYPRTTPPSGEADASSQ
jgi:diguanylate cyclase (GGDEF)-like protein